MSFSLSDTETIYFTPDDAAAALAALLALINGAQHTTLLQMYGFTHVLIVDAMAAAAKRGVDVRCIFDHSQASGPTEVGMLHRLLLTVPAANVRIGTSTVNHALLHIKALTIDGAIVAHGSLNHSPSAFQQLNDWHVIQSSALATQYTALFERTWAFVDSREPQYQRSS